MCRIRPGACLNKIIIVFAKGYMSHPGRGVPQCTRARRLQYTHPVPLHRMKPAGLSSLAVISLLVETISSVLRCANQSRFPTATVDGSMPKMLELDRWLSLRGLARAHLVFDRAEPSDLCWFGPADLKKLTSSQKEQLLRLPWVQNAPIGEGIRKALGPSPSFSSVKATQPAATWREWPSASCNQMMESSQDMLFSMDEEPAANDLDSSFGWGRRKRGSNRSGDSELDAVSPMGLLFEDSSGDEDDTTQTNRGDGPPTNDWSPKEGESAEALRLSENCSLHSPRPCSPTDDSPPEEDESAENALQSRHYDLRSSGPRLIVGVPQPSPPEAVDPKVPSANFRSTGPRPPKRKLISELDLIREAADDRVCDNQVEEEDPWHSSRKLERVHSAGHCQSNFDEPTVPLKFPPWKSSSSSRISNIYGNQ